ncbi:unnamed protein product [Mytilus coruscus]|uniref:Uncharacterized protein n=1 Tax=Mytilus coruscus TaxID=42192 RepID=A0A6J8D2J7_MYTCO|nr:unnamed protein product [Mytilus coruscus]
MLISTCYIIFTLCRRKRVRGHATVSRAEKKSCILIVCVMIVFLLAELPRIYVSSTLFSTYRSNLDTQNVALQKTKTELSQRFAACLDDIPNHNISDESCISDYGELPTHYKDGATGKVEDLTLELENRVYWIMDWRYRRQFKQNYFDYLDDVFAAKHVRYARELKEYVKQTFFDIVEKTYCNATEKYLQDIMRNVYFDILHYRCLYTIDNIDNTRIVTVQRTNELYNEHCLGTH